MPKRTTKTIRRTAATAGGLALIDNDAEALLADYPYPGGGSRPHGVFYEPQVLR